MCASAQAGAARFDMKAERMLHGAIGANGCDKQSRRGPRRPFHLKLEAGAMLACMMREASDAGAARGRVHVHRAVHRHRIGGVRGWWLVTCVTFIRSGSRDATSDTIYIVCDH